MASLTCRAIVIKNGAAYLDGTGIKVVEVIRTWLHHEQSSDSLSQAYPNLTPAQLAEAVAYYRDHRQEVDEELEQRDRFVEQLQKDAAEHPFTQRMRRLGRLPE